MAWNEPGGGKEKDPWGREQGPPDLDEAFRKFKKKFTGKGGSGSKPGSGDSFPELSPNIIGIIFAVIVFLWALLGIYQVDEQEKGVVTTFGKYSGLVDPGLHWNPPIIDTVQKVNVTKVNSSTHKGLMLTEDDNIVEVSISVQYTISDPKAFLLDIREPEISLAHAAESSIRHVVGSSKLNEVLTNGKVAIAIAVKERLQKYLNSYKTGILISTVNIEDAQPPKEVQAAFDDVIRAKEDEARVVNQAETYKNGIIPESRGLAKRQIEEANGYKEQVVSRAQGEAQRFTQLLTEYTKAPEVTRQRLYIDTMQKVMSKSSKVMVDVNGNNVMYLPLDKMINANAANIFEKTPQTTAYTKPVQTLNPIPVRESAREGR